MNDLQSALGQARFTLRTSMTSPFGRKVRMAAAVLNLTSRIDVVHAVPQDEHDTLRNQNPLGKMPTLLLPDGTALYDSPVLIEFLQELAGTTRLIPSSGIARYRMLMLGALADGIMDAGILVVYETRWRPSEMYVEKWVDYQRGKIRRGLAAFAADPPEPADTTLAGIGLSCALGYMDWRKQIDWRAEYPALTTWLEHFAAHEAAFNATIPDYSNA